MYVYTILSCEVESGESGDDRRLADKLPNQQEPVL